MSQRLEPEKATGTISIRLDAMAHRFPPELASARRSPEERIRVTPRTWARVKIRRPAATWHRPVGRSTMVTAASQAFPCRVRASRGDGVADSRARPDLPIEPSHARGPSRVARRPGQGSEVVTAAGRWTARRWGRCAAGPAVQAWSPSVERRRPHPAPCEPPFGYTVTTWRPCCRSASSSVASARESVEARPHCHRTRHRALDVPESQGARHPHATSPARDVPSHLLDPRRHRHRLDRTAEPMTPLFRTPVDVPDLDLPWRRVEYCVTDVE